MRRLHETNDTALVVGATIGLPFLDRRRDAVAAAEARAEAATYEQASVALAAREAVASAQTSAVTAAAALAEIDGTVIPLSERAYAAVLEGYQAAGLDCLRSLTRGAR